MLNELKKTNKNFNSIFISISKNHPKVFAIHTPILCLIDHKLNYTKFFAKKKMIKYCGLLKHK